MVAGIADNMRVMTGWRKLMELPRLPRAASHSQITNCTGTGLSKPICWRSAAESAAVADGGSIMASGSTGSSRSTTNTTSDSSSKVGIATSRRRTTMAKVSCSMASTSNSAAAVGREAPDHLYLYSTGST